MNAPGPEVRTAAGAVRGTKSGTVSAFRGIPYARPPVGELRFAAPESARSWADVREASSFGPSPPQSLLAGPAPPAPADHAGPDEWLTVNVWSPNLRSVGLPVMVWIHGGAYMVGHSANPTYDGSRIAREGDVVVVTFNYRVAVEGFVFIEGAPANRGLLDQLAALRWVRENIAAFGGDPDRVTVFGQSAGGGSVAALLAMPQAAGLFRQAITQSVPRMYISTALARDMADELALVLSRKATRTDLMEVEPRRLVEAGDALARRMGDYADRWGSMAGTPSPYAPVVDGDVLPRDPWCALAAGASRDVPLVVGHTRNEYRLFMALAGQFGKVTEEQAEHALRVFAPGGKAEAYRTAYPRADAEELYEIVISDWAFRMPSLALAEAHAAAGGNAHLYELAHRAPGMGGAMGAPHGADVPLVFGNFRGGAAAPAYDGIVSAMTESLGAEMRAAWTRFARTGNPGWPSFTAGERLTRVYDAEPFVVPYPEEASRGLWESEPFDILDLGRG